MRRDLPSYEELIKIFTADKLKVLRIITIAICMGAIFFFMVTMLLYSTSYGSQAENSNPNLLEILLSVMAMVSISLYTVVIFMGDKFLDGIIKSYKLTSTEISIPESRALIATITSFTIVRLAMFEGAAFFGLLILFLSIQWGELNSNPVYWLAILPMLIMFLYVAKIFPTSERVAQLVQDKIYPFIDE